MSNLDTEAQTAGALAEHCRDIMQAADLHFGHGTDNAQDEAAWLVLHVMGQDLDGSFEDWDLPVSASSKAEILDLLGQRIRTRMPLAYLLGEAWFCGLAFEVGPAVLVPRSPMAELISRDFTPWVQSDGLRHVLDLCTGSACIGIAMAARWPQLRVVASDISRAALEVAQRNCLRHAVHERVELVRSDLFEALGGQRFDLIVSNPPYVPDDVVAGLPPEYRAEPRLGLASGGDGLDLPLRILLDAANYLEENGVLVCEVGESAGALQQALERVPLTWIDFEQGGEGVFTMNRQALHGAMPMVRDAIERRTGLKADVG